MSQSRLTLLSAFLLSGIAFGQTHWTPRPSGTTQNLGPLFWKADTLFCLAGPDVLITTDGITWGKSAMDQAHDLGKIVWTGSQFVGINGSNVLYLSPDALHWKADTLSPDAYSTQANDIVWTGKQLVRTGNGAYTSPDGIHWKTLHYGIEKYNDEVVAWTGRQIVTGRGDGYVGTYSEEGDSGAAFTAKMRTNNTPSLVFWTGKSLLLISAGEINKTAGPGSPWTLRWYTGPGPARIVQTRSQLIASPLTRQFLTSTDDGDSWALRDSDAPDSLNDITWTGSLLVAVGKHGMIATAPDELPPGPAGLEGPGKAPPGTRAHRGGGVFAAPARGPVRADGQALRGRRRASLRGAD